MARRCTANSGIFFRTSFELAVSFNELFSKDSDLMGSGKDQSPLPLRNYRLFIIINIDWVRKRRKSADPMKFVQLRFAITCNM